MTETDLLAETLHEGGDQELECSLGVEPSKNRITNTLTKRNFTTTGTDQIQQDQLTKLYKTS